MALTCNKYGSNMYTKTNTYITDTITLEKTDQEIVQGNHGVSSFLVYNMT